MDPLFVQNLRYKLQKRIGRLNSVEPGTFRFALIQFWRFFDEQPTFVGIAKGMLAQVPDYEESVNRIFAGEKLHGSTEVEAAALGYGVLRRLANIEELAIYRLPFTHSVVRELFLDPFYEYVDEQVDDQRAMLALLLRYKHRSEWFHRDNLNRLCQENTRRAEKQLALDLYAFLYDQGIDFMIEPSSVTGEVDLITGQNTSDPLVLDAKVFDGDGRGKTYLRKGFAQIYTYTQQYNEPFGYLVIYKTTDRDLRFTLRRAAEIPVVVHNHKTIFMITIDIFPHDKPVSQRSPLQAIEVTEEELTGMLGADTVRPEETKG